MAPLNPNNTARLWYDYVTGTLATSREHTVCWRYNAGDVTVDAAQAAFLAFLTALGAANLRTGWKVIRVRQAAAGSDFSIPVNPIAGLVAFVGTGNPPYLSRHETVEDSYQFRSMTSGRRGDFSLYRAVGDAAENFRFAMPAAQGTALTAAAGSGALRVIDGSIPGIYTYVNQNYNSYWESRSRTN